ncbi:MAG: hypothetical protein Q9159_006416 [Coniocarpon cinnabarinum]
MPLALQLCLALLYAFTYAIHYPSYCEYPLEPDPSLYDIPWPKAPSRRQPMPNLNARKYSDITFIGAHNSEALRTPENDWSLFGNQYFNLTTQLDSGVRVIQAQGHRDPEGTAQIRLCHSFCVFMDGGSLDGYLTEAKAWLDANPGEFLTFVWVNVRVPLPHWVMAYYNTGFDVISYAPPEDKRGRMRVDDWPTIDEMLDSGKRAVTFLSNGADEDRIPWLLSEFDYVFETAYDNEDPENFDCEVERPCWPHSMVPDRLSFVNHFLYAKAGFGFVYPNATYANHTNGAGTTEGELGEHAMRCRARYERRPNFLLVDFFNEGDVWAVEHGMNAF